MKTKVTEYHQTSPIFIGSKKEVEAVVDKLK